MGDGPPGLFARFVSYGFVSELLRIVLETGALGQADLLALPAEHSVPRLVALYDDARRGGGGVYRGFFAVVRWQLFVGAAFQLVYVLSQLSQPVFVWLIVRSIEDDTMLGLYAALGLLAAMLVGNWCNQSHLHVMDVAALRLRGVAVAVMYRAAVEARTFEAAGTSAELVSIIATDTERFRDMAPFFQLLWASPAQIVLGAGLTVVIFGWQALIAVGILLGLYPVAMLLAQALRHARRLMQPFTEERVRLISELLHGTRVVKMYGWERPMLAAIRRVRALEMGQFVKELLVWAVVSCCLVSVPQVAQAATFAAFVHTEGPLRSADTFALLTLLGVIKFPVVYFGNAIMFLSQTVVGMERIRQFLDASGADRTTKPAPAVPVSPDSSSDLLKVHAARCLWKRPPAEPFDLGDAPAKAFELGPVDLTLRRRDVCVVLGPVGAGKSMLCDAVLGETWAAGGSVAVGAQSVAFAAQEPFLFTGTVRDNVLFHTPLDPARYAACLDACQLRADLAVLGEGDLTVVGERGVTLSGGQKARVALARACYAKADLVVLDDPLSALDARTGRLVLEALLGPGGLLRESGVLLVTHGHHHQWCANKRLALVDGAGAATALSRTADAALSSDSDDDGPADAEEDAPAVEELQEGNISLATLRRYVQQGGGWHWPVTVFLGVLLERVLYVASELWLSVWTSAADGPPTNGLIPGLRSAATEDGGRWYLYIYVGLSVATLLGATVRLLAFGRGCYRAAGSLFGGALEAVARCPAVWYDVTPTGRVLNRLSHDVDRVQYPLVAQLSSFVATLGWLSSGVVTTGAAAPYSLIATVPAIAAVAFLVWRFRVLNVHLQRLDIVARSVVQSFVFESLHGATTIRAFRRVDEAEAQCRASLADNLAAMYSFALAQRWLGVRCDSLGALITGSVALVCWLLRSSVDPSVAGFAFVWATNIARSLVFVVTDGVQSEAKLVSVERLVEYLDSLPKEAPAATETVPALPWPAQGRLEFKGATMRYRPELPLVLDGCTFAAEPGQRVGVVGRTGSGKSSLIVALFRLRELEGGQVLVDGQDIADLGLAHLRGQSMCIIPQDPVVFSGTVRSNVDPFEEFGDDAVQAAIEAVSLGPKVEAMGGIEAPTAAKGANLSVGQRQLLCIARAVLRRPRVLLMDEATANVDSRTDALIRDAVRRLFRGCTVVEVAHRLHSVMDADRIVVMGAGKVLEAGAPRALLARKGELHRMVHAAGDAAALAAMVQ